ncbi:MAG: D-aminoacyl-tRNA deacylase [Rhodanobacteraceae bacterium]
MIGLIQRVSEARVEVAGAPVGQIGPGLLVLVAVQPQDDERHARRLLERLLGYRVFEDADGRMNLSLTDTDGGLLLVPQFTLAADTRSGMRPSFSGAAAPAEAGRWFQLLVELARARHAHVASGRFGAFMQVHLVNQGPVTFLLDTG